MEAYDLSRPVLAQDLQPGLVVWSTMLHYMMEVTVVTESGVVQLKKLNTSGGRSLTLRREAFKQDSTMFYHLYPGVVMPDELAELRAIAHALITTGNTMLGKLDALAEKRR